LLDALRERLGLTGTKKGCDQGDPQVPPTLKSAEPALYGPKGLVTFDYSWIGCITAPYRRGNLPHSAGSPAPRSRQANRCRVS
jgi:hypothetical protein